MGEAHAEPKARFQLGIKRLVSLIGATEAEFRAGTSLRIRRASESIVEIKLVGTISSNPIHTNAQHERGVGEARDGVGHVWGYRLNTEVQLLILQ